MRTSTAVAMVLVLLGTSCACTKSATSNRASPVSGGTAEAKPVAQPAVATGKLASGVTIADVVSRALCAWRTRSRPTAARVSTPTLPFNDPFLRRFFGMPFDGPQHQQEMEKGLGSGVIVDKNVILTNNHVIEDADDITVTTADDHEFKAKVVGRDPKNRP